MSLTEQEIFDQSVQAASARREIMDVPKLLSKRIQYVNKRITQWEAQHPEFPSGPLCVEVTILEGCRQRAEELETKAGMADKFAESLSNVVDEMYEMDKGDCASRPCIIQANSLLTPWRMGKPKPPERCPRVPDSIIGNILDHWDLIENDTKQDWKDQETGFYNSMEQLQTWMYKNR